MSEPLVLLSEEHDGTDEKHDQPHHFFGAKLYIVLIDINYQPADQLPGKNENQGIGDSQARYGLRRKVYDKGTEDTPQP